MLRPRKIFKNVVPSSKQKPQNFLEAQNKFFQAFPSSRCSTRSAYKLLLRYSLSFFRFELIEVNDLMRAFQADGATRLGTACDWLRANEARWRDWIPDPTLCSLVSGEFISCVPIGSYFQCLDSTIDIAVVPHEAVPEVSKGKVFKNMYLNQKKNVRLEIVCDMWTCGNSSNFAQPFF